MKKFLSSILFLVLGLGIWFGIKYPVPTAMPKVLTQAEVLNQINSAIQTLKVQQAPSQPMAGATIPVVVSVYEDSLAAKITSAATSMTLVRGKDNTGTSLSGYICFTLDEGSASAEFVCGTTSGTSVTSMTRGISPITGTSTVASLQFEHRRGASVKITNYPQLAIISRILNGNETLPNPLRYDSTVSTSTLATNGSYVASVNYVNGIAFAGAPNATTTIQGLVQAGTAAQLAIGTQNGSTGAVLFAPGNLFASSSSATTLIPVTQSNGKLSTGFIDQTANYTWSGTHSFSATTTFATSTFNGLVTFNGGASLGSLSFTAATSTAPGGNATTTSTFVAGFQPKTITVYYKLQGSNTGTAWYSAGVAIFNGTTLVSNIITYSNLAASTALTAHTNLNPDPVSTYPIVDANSDDIDLRIGSVTATGFTVATHHYGASNGVGAQFTVVATQ